MNVMVVYALNKATEAEICNHLSSCDAEFVRDLTERGVDIAEYGKKIHTRAVRFEAWSDDVLVGLVAAYCNDLTKQMAYITSVSVLNQWQGKGIAAQLIRRSIEHAESLGMKGISLEVAGDNMPAIGLYEKYGFVLEENEIGDSFLKMNLFFDEGNYVK
jgi:ribosomal protein S18 acetylase RimI-like enzyme